MYHSGVRRQGDVDDPDRVRRVHLQGVPQTGIGHRQRNSEDVLDRSGRCRVRTHKGNQVTPADRDDDGAGPPGRAVAEDEFHLVRVALTAVARTAVPDLAQTAHRAAGMHGHADSHNEIADGVGKLVDVDGVPVDLDGAVDGRGGRLIRIFGQAVGGCHERGPAQRDLVRAQDAGRGVDCGLQPRSGGEISRGQVAAGQPSIPAQPLEGVRIAGEQRLPAAQAEPVDTDREISCERTQARTVGKALESRYPVTLSIAEGDWVT